MPVTKKYNRPQLFGIPDCVFAIVDFKNFLASALEYATVVGTLSEVVTPYGTGLRVDVANSYVYFDWTSLAPLAASPRSIFVRAYVPDNTAHYDLAAYGVNAVRNGFYVANNLGQYEGGFVNDMDTGGAIVAGTWLSYAVTNQAETNGPNEIYGQGVPVASGLNGGNGVTATSNLYLFRTPWGIGQCPVGTIIQEVLMFRRVVAAAEVLDMHNAVIGNKP